MTTMKYFAYGSNMLESRLTIASRAPSAEFSGIGILDGYKLFFHKVGKDGSGKCNIMKTGFAGDRVYGVIYELLEDEFIALDKEEDIQRGGYCRKQISVHSLEADSKVVVEAYFANFDFIDNEVLPFDWYRALILAGACHHKLPYGYVESIGNIATLVDSDQDRRDRFLKLLKPYTHYFSDTMSLKDVNNLE